MNAMVPLATVQTCIIHLTRGTFRYASRNNWAPLSKDLKPPTDLPLRPERGYRASAEDSRARGRSGVVPSFVHMN